jgi:hypothetical protein
VAAAVCSFHVAVYLARHLTRLRGRDVQARAKPLTTSALVRQLLAFLVECGAFTVTFACALCRRNPPVPRASASRRPVILLHGYAMSAGSFLWMARRLRQDGWTWVWAISCTPAFGDIRRNARMLAAAVEQARHLASADRVDIVAHSMGGLVARAYIKAGGAPSVHRLITLGTPHRGTVNGTLGGLVDPMVRQMRIGSPLLEELARDDPVPHTVNVVSIYSRFDAIVIPPENAHYPGALNVELDGVGHTGLLLSRRVYELIRKSLATEESELSSRGPARV